MTCAETCYDQASNLEVPPSIVSLSNWSSESRRF